MTTAHNIDLPAVLAERLTTCHPDVLRELLATFIHTLMGAEADGLCGAGYGQRSSGAHQLSAMAIGTVNSIPEQAHWIWLSRSCVTVLTFPDWLLERRKRAERALTTVVATCYLLGVSTRRMDKLVETLGITSACRNRRCR